MAIYIYKISTSYHNNKEWVAGFIENHKNNHQDGNWYFIHQKEEFSLYKLPDGEIYTYTDDDFKYSYDEEEEGYGTTLVQTRDSEINNYMIDFEEKCDRKFHSDTKAFCTINTIYTLLTRY